MSISINPQPLQIGSFSILWIDLFIANHEKYLAWFKAIHGGYLNSSLELQVKKDMKLLDPFSFVYGRFCWENVVIPTYALNGEKMVGRYKILTNAKKEKYHFVIFDEVSNFLFDPTYEKAADSILFEDSPCKGLACTKVILGNECIYFDLDYFLKTFDLPGEKRLIEQIREAGTGFITSINSALL